MNNLITQRIIYPGDDGIVSIIVPMPNCGLTIQEIADKDVPEGKPHKIIDVSEIPTDPTFRDAWEGDGEGADLTTIAVNMDKAKGIWRDKWRKERGPLLENLDVQWMRATESRDEVKQDEIAQKKQELRDVTETDLESVDETDQLKSIWPDCLTQS